LRLGLVGCGRLAQVGYGPAFRRAHDVRLVAVADPHRERRRSTAGGAADYESVRELVADEDVEAVVVATPVATHVEIATEAARAGVPALVEKPPARTAAETGRLGELDPAPSIGFNRRFEGALAELREQIPADGALELRLAFDRRSTWGSYSGEDPLLLDVGPHAFDLVRWLSGAEVARVRARERPHGATVELELAGERGSATVEVRTNRPFVEEVEVRSGDALVGRHRTGGLAAGIAARVGRGSESPLVPSLARQLDAFAAAVRGASERGVGTVDDAVAVMATVDAARASAAHAGEWQSISGESRECSRSFSSTR
jgi:predicted dehydrogenase